MVKFIIVFVLLFTSLQARVNYQHQLDNAIKTIIGENAFARNKRFIHVIFSPASRYFKRGRVNSVKVVSTLKANGLVRLIYKKPRTINLTFITNTNPILFVKTIEDSLRNIGYYRFVTKDSSYDTSSFSWTITMQSESIVDPELLQKELVKRGSYIFAIARKDPFSWEYKINTDYVQLDAIKLSTNTIQLKRSMVPYWIDVKNIFQLSIESQKPNMWHPYLALYDNNLHLIQVVKKDKITHKLVLRIPKEVRYLKIADIYMMKNIKAGLHLEATK